MICDLNGSLGSRQFLNVVNERTYIHTLLSLPLDFRVAYAANISEHLTIRRQHFLLSYLKTLSVCVRPGFEPATSRTLVRNSTY